MPSLFDSYTVKSVTLRNRIGVAPMCQYSAEDGVANDWHLVHLGSRASGGAALVIMEATGVSPEGRISTGCTGIWSDRHAQALEPITRFISSQGSVPGIQIAHSGRKGSEDRPGRREGQLPNEEGGWTTLAPSAIPFGGSLTKVPHAMTEADIARVQGEFAAAAKRAHAAGFKWLEIHAAHGYLGHEFLSPLSNTRTDRYGGSLENRMRFVIETTRVVRAVWPDSLPLSIRLSCTDWTPGGWTPEETVILCRSLKKEGVDVVDCSSGGNVATAQIPVAPNYQVGFAEKVKNEANIATAAVGLITEARQADQIIREGRADLVYLARELLRDPYWPLHAAKVLGENARGLAPAQYARAF